MVSVNLLNLAKKALLTALCVAMVAFVFPSSSAGKAVPHQYGAEVSTDNDDHEEHSHDDATEPGHAERHLADHTHDTLGNTAIPETSDATPINSAQSLPQPRILSLTPPPIDRPPDVLTLS